MTRKALTVIFMTALTACSAAAPPSAATESAAASDVMTVAPTPAATEQATPEETAVATVSPSAPAIAADELVLNTSDLPADLAFAQAIDREITPDMWENLFGPEYRAQLESRGFVSGRQRSFDGVGRLITVGSSSYVFSDAEGARSFQDWLAGPEWSGCSEPFDAGADFGDVSTAALCPGTQFSGDGAEIVFARDRAVIELSLRGTVPGEAGPRLDLLADLAHALESKIPS